MGGLRPVCWGRVAWRLGDFLGCVTQGDRQGSWIWALLTSGARGFLVVGVGGCHVRQPWPPRHRCMSAAPGPQL